MGMSSGVRPPAWAVLVVTALGACTSGSDGATGARTNAPAVEATIMTTMPQRATSTTEVPAVSPAQTAIEVRLDDYAIEPRANTVPAGRITLKATNRDDVPHDVVLVRTTLPPDRLPRSGIRVDESDLAIEILARTARLDPLRTGSFSASLGPGVYVLVCTVPHHYVRDAMVATITVSG